MCHYQGCRFFSYKARTETCQHHTVNPAKLQEPAVGTLCISNSRYNFLDGRVVKVVQQSYMWAPNDPSFGGGVINYGECVIEYEQTSGGSFKRVVVNNNTLTPIKVGEFIK